ncbi:hypothetical protein FAZ15_09960 [Sphingobacterium olei]|uniref:Uncharacterized protein n=1 Tax=Sphingobacterium olei TaxID=2571155 RepID=A0A4U0P2M9_9SPHI|nr:hypothetical protein [Sphingobacterium olei]TJZ61505.1 hypothetical protein FAZ15_09960 [Sphingobacterium olei]
MMNPMIKHFLPRFVVAAGAMLLLVLQHMETQNGGGNNGMGLKIGLYLSLFTLLFEGIFLLCEMLYLLYKSQYKPALINVGLLLVGLLLFLFLARQ